MQASHLKSETETYEEKEQQLVSDCVKELRKFPSSSVLFPGLFALQHPDRLCLPDKLPGLSSLQISAIAEELARKTEDASRQQEEITHLLSQIVDLQKKAKSVSAPLLI